MISQFSINSFSILSRINKSILTAAMSTGEIHKKVLVPIANGSEEIEAVTIIDTLVRAGAKVVVASVENTLNIKCSRGVKLTADFLIHDCVNQHWDLIALPGGMPGAENLRNNKELSHLLKHQNDNYKLIGAICAAPAIVLASQNLLKDTKATCYPSPKLLGMISKYSEERVVQDSNIITSQGPGTSLEFSLKLVEALYGKEKAATIPEEMLSR